MELENDFKCQIITCYKISNYALAGAVIISAVHTRIIQLAIVEITGTAECSWKQDKTMLCPKFVTHGTEFTASEEFYYSRHTLCGGDIPHRLKGAQKFYFSCGWPSRVPGSFTGECGTIKYTGKVTIHESQSVSVHAQKLEIGHYRDLSLEQHLLHESRVDVHRTFQMTLAHLGSLDVSVWVPITGVCAGQALPVLCTVVNNSKLHFGGLVFVLTKIEIYISQKPVVCAKKIRTDICRVARIVDIHSGKHDYYCMLDIEEDTPPTSQFYKCNPIQIIYELWVSVQGAFSSKSGLGYPDTHTPVIPIIIGTEPIRFYNSKMITSRVMTKLLAADGQVIMDMLPLDEEVEELLHNADEELDEETIKNLNRQMMENEVMLNKKIIETASGSIDSQSVDG